MKKKKLEIRYGITWRLGKESEAHKIHFLFGNVVPCRVGLKTLNYCKNTKSLNDPKVNRRGKEKVKKPRRTVVKNSKNTTQKKKKNGTNTKYYMIHMTKCYICTCIALVKVVELILWSPNHFFPKPYTIII